MRVVEAIERATIEKIVDALAAAGGTAYVVGGAVRDKYIPGQPASKDVDFLVTGLQRDEIVDALRPIGKAKEVGEAFGVVTATVDGEDFDFALPRTAERKTGEGHTEFDVDTDPYADPREDLARRDFTFNAMMEDPITGELVDPFGGRDDLANKVVRTVGDPHERFREDPLRMLRAIQFAARFGFTIEPETAAAIRDLADTLKSVSGERVLMELQKAWTKGAANSSVLVDLIEELGIGDVFFGPDFSPIAIKFGGSPREKELANFIAFFINGGDYTTMKPSNDFVEYLKLAQSAVEHAGHDVWKWAGADRWRKTDPDRLTIVAHVLEALYDATGDGAFADAASGIDEVADMPLSTKELAISGRDLMDAGMKGKQIGQSMQHALKAVHAGSVRNERQSLLDFLGLSTVDEQMLRMYVRLVLESTSSQYVGIVIDKDSRRQLLEHVPPVHQNVTADHVTLVHGPTPEDLEMFSEGEPVPVRVVGYAEDEKGQAVVVRLPKHFMELTKRRPHITISTAPGVQQYYSNELIERGVERPPVPLVLRGTVAVVGS